jgi:predicted nuclease of predicted toxin-antitoxin system
LKLLADENVDRPIVARLRTEGHVVVYVLELAPSIPDPEVASLAARESALLLTADKDFGELMFRQHRVAQGVILIRLSGLSAELKGAIVASAVREHSTELPGNFTVITPGGVRIRKSVVG